MLWAVWGPVASLLAFVLVLTIGEVVGGFDSDVIVDLMGMGLLWDGGIGGVWYWLVIVYG